MIAINDFISDFIANDIKIDPMKHQHVLDLDRIAPALGKIQRYAGNFPYANSVAAHSRRVRDLVLRQTTEPRTLLVALLHDAHETVLGDIPYMVRHEFRELSLVDTSMSKWFVSAIVAGVTDKDWTIVHVADARDARNEFSIAGWMFPGNEIPDDAGYTSAIANEMALDRSDEHAASLWLSDVRMLLRSVG